MLRCRGWCGAGAEGGRDAAHRAPQRWAALGARASRNVWKRVAAAGQFAATAYAGIKIRLSHACGRRRHVRGGAGRQGGWLHRGSAPLFSPFPFLRLAPRPTSCMPRQSDPVSRQCPSSPPKWGGRETAPRRVCAGTGSLCKRLPPKKPHLGRARGRRGDARAARGRGGTNQGGGSAEGKHCGGGGKGGGGGGDGFWSEGKKTAGFHTEGKNRNPAPCRPRAWPRPTWTPAS